MEQWISEGLSRVLDFEVPDEMIKYIISIESEADFNEYMKSLLDFENAQHRNFFTELAKKKFPVKGNPQPRQKKKISKSKQPQQEFVTAELKEEASSEKPEKEGKHKKKTKFVNLYSKEGENAQVVLLKGRHRCDCEANSHELINNCLNCGRIVCKQEGSGPCLFCGNLVCTPEEEKEIQAKTKSGSKLKAQLMEQTRPQGWEEAVAHMNKLLDYQKNSEKRSQVVDDDCDYFHTNSVWLSEQEKTKFEQYQQELQEKKHASRREKKITFDFAGRQIVEDKTIQGVELERLREITGGAGAAGEGREFYNDMLSGGGGGVGVGVLGGRDVAPGVDAALFQFDPSVENQGMNYSAVMKSSSSSFPRVQDAQLQEMSDTGKCLSMHQPWASLLVEGIKLHEGRTWYTSHRGRLWIAATAQQPDLHAVSTTENQYRVLYPERNIKFPTFYPTGCLLGCVIVEDCLPQEEYDKLYPGAGGESDSPYVLICSNPISLRLRFPIKGYHKIYQLDKTIHKAALKCIQNMKAQPKEDTS